MTKAKLLSLIFMAITPALAAEIALFKAQYDLAIDGITIAKEWRELSKNDNLYTFTARAKSSGIIAFLQPYQIDARSQFIVNKNGLYTQKYQLKKQKNKKIKQDTKLSTASQTLTHLGTKKSYPLQRGKNYVDKLNLFIALSAALANNNEQKQYIFEVIKKNGTERYIFSQQGTENIQFKQKSTPAIKLAYHSPKKNKEITVWLDPKQHYIPIVIKQKDSSGSYQYTLVEMVQKPAK